MNAKKMTIVAACGWILSSTACQRKHGDTKSSDTASPVRGEPASLAQARASAPGVKFYEPGPERPLPTVQLNPADLTTSAGQGAMHVLVANLGAPVGTDLLNGIAKSIVLKTWPGQASVPITVSKVEDATGKAGQDGFAHIYLTPTSPLTDAWYALGIDVLPKGVAWAPKGNLFQLESGGRATRFRVGAGAVTSGVRVYSKDQGRQVVYVDLSEQVPAESTVAISYSDGKGAGCQAETPAGQPASAAPAGKDATGIALPAGAASDTKVTRIRLGCSGGLDLAQPILVNVRLGGTQAMAASGSLALAITPDSWSDSGDGGKLFKPTLP
jgi:hypothetical protein